MADDDQYTFEDQTNSNGDTTVKERETTEQESNNNNGYSPPNNNYSKKKGGSGEESMADGESLYAVISALLSSIFFPDPKSSLASASFFHRIRASLKHHLPRLREASRTSGMKVLRWARRGSPLRMLLVISVGTITLLTLTGILVFMLFLAAATVNAIIISLFVSLATAGGVLAMFFASMAIIYIGAISVAIFVISTATISAIIAALIVTGWIGFFWTVWVALKKSAHLAQHSVGATTSAISTWQAHRNRRHHHD